MHSVTRILMVLSSLVVACESTEPRTSPEALDTLHSAGLVQPQAVEVLHCEGALEADGSRVLRHGVRFFADGSVSTTCTVEIAGTQWLGSASYEWGRTGQPGAVCFVGVDAGPGAYWRFSLAGDRRSTIATYYSGGSSPRLREWLLPCR